MDNLSKYLENQKFILWVFQPNEELEAWWKSYISENPQNKKNIQLARNIISSLKTSDKNLSEEEKIFLFSKVLKKIEEEQDLKNKYRWVSSLLKYAAVAILFFSIGAILFYRKDNFNSQFYTQQLSEPISENEATLIRPNGENIVIHNKKSVIEYRNDGQVKVNNDVLESTNSIEKGVPALNQLIIPYGKTSEIMLTDGTKVYLNAGSRLVYPDYFVDKNREVFLVGEAFFEVKTDEKHPFVVQTTDLRIKVTGTQFNVSSYPLDNIIEIVLKQGKVRLEENNTGLLSESVDLFPNQLASFNRTTKGMELKEVNIDDYILWKEGIYKFESTDLNRIVKRLERYYSVRFIYADPFLGTIRISGKLELEQNFDETINRLAIAASIRIIDKGENLYEIRK